MGEERVGSGIFKVWELGVTGIFLQVNRIFAIRESSKRWEPFRKENELGLKIQETRRSDPCPPSM